MTRFPLAAALTAALALAGCETATPYQPLAASNAISGGYSEQKLDDTHFRVSFKGNDVTSRSKVESYLLYRAAELTAVQGDDWFEMVDKHTHDDQQAYVDPGFGPGWGAYWRPSWTYFDRPGFGPWAGGPWMGVYSIDTVDHYEASAVIAMGHGPRPTGDARAFDARQVMQNLGPTVGRAQ
jgi:hypothetical protein